MRLQVLACVSLCGRGGVCEPACVCVEAGMYTWESTHEPRALRLSGFEWQFLCICDWVSVLLRHLLSECWFQGNVGSEWVRKAYL